MKLNKSEIEALANKIYDEYNVERNKTIKAEEQSALEKYKKTKQYSLIEQLKKELPEGIDLYFKKQGLSRDYPYMFDINYTIKSRYMSLSAIKDAIVLAQLDNSNINDIIATVKKQLISN